jgi:phage shock protein E
MLGLRIKTLLRQTGFPIIVALASVGTIAVVDGVYAAEVTAPSFQTITSAQLATMLEDKNFAFINVHIPYEGEIAPTDAFIPFDEIGAKLDLLPADKDAAIVLYCRSGRMSEIAANELAALGYSNVSHLAGGMVDWEKTGHALIRN